MNNETEQVTNEHKQDMDIKQEEDNQENINNIENKKESNGFYAELISRYIIEKLISVVVRQKEMLNVDNMMGNHCFNFIQDQLKPLYEIGFISHEIDTGNKTDIPEVFFNNPDTDYENTWMEIPEPQSQELDRYAGSKIRLIKPPPRTEQADKEKDNAIVENGMPVITSEGNLKETGNLHSHHQSNISMRTKKSMKRLKLSSSSLSSNKTNESNKREEIKAFQAQLKAKMADKQKKIEISNEDDENKPDDNPIIDLPSYDIPENVFYNKYKEAENTLDLENLRKEREIEIKRKEEEKRIKAEKEKRERYNSIMANRPKKDFDGGKFTFDSDGKIIQIKAPPLELLASEFWWSKPHIKDGNMKRGSIFNNRRSTGKQSLMKPKSNREKIESASERKGITLSNNPSQMGSPSTQRRSTVKKEDIIFNINPEDNFNWRTPKNKNNVPIVVSGENFSLFRPEIGVVITSGENNNKKEGGMEFSRKFNKPSMNEFSQMVLESQNLNSRKYLSSLSIDSPQNDPNAYLGYHKHFGTDTNPLIQNSQSIIPSQTSNDKVILPSLYKSTNMRGYRSEMLDSMKLLSTEIPNIKSVLEDNPEDDKDNDIATLINKSKNKNKINNSNLFSFIKKKKGLRNLQSSDNTIKMNIMDKFNSKIIKDKVWGDVNDDEFIGKPNSKQKRIKRPKITHLNNIVQRDRKRVLSGYNSSNNI